MFDVLIQFILMLIIGCWLILSIIFTILTILYENWSSDADNFFRDNKDYEYCLGIYKKLLIFFKSRFYLRLMYPIMQILRFCYIFLLTFTFPVTGFIIKYIRFVKNGEEIN